MTADTPARVSDEDVSAALRRCGLLGYSKGMEDLLLDLRDSRALTQAQAERIAALEAEVRQQKAESIRRGRLPFE